MFDRVARSKPVRVLGRTYTAAMDSILGRSFVRLGGAKPRVLGSAMAFNLFFASVPLVFAFIAIASAAGRDEEALAELEAFLSVLPDSVAAFLVEIIQSAADALGDATGIAVAVSTAVALYSGSRASLTLMEAIEVIEGVADRRSFITKRAIGIAASAGLMVALGVLVIALVLSDAIVTLLDGAGLATAATAVDLLAEPVAAVSLAAFLLGFFTWAPPQPLPGRWTATIASGGGIALASFGFGWAANLGLFGESTTFAILGNVALVLIWLYAISYVLLVATSFAVTIASEDPPVPLWSE